MYLFAMAIHFRTCRQVNKRQRTRSSWNKNAQDETEPTIPPSQSQPDELNAGKQLIPNKLDTIEPPMNDTGSSSLPDATNESPHLQPPNNPPDVSCYG
jgi:hypothetical protein